MKIKPLNWMQVEAYWEHDGRVVMPLGDSEQHTYLIPARSAYPYPSVR
jgi:hypothetical protein